MQLQYAVRTARSTINNNSIIVVQFHLTEFKEIDKN